MSRPRPRSSLRSRRSASAARRRTLRRRHVRRRRLCARHSRLRQMPRARHRPAIPTRSRAAKLMALTYEGRLTLALGRYSRDGAPARGAGEETTDGVVLDLGISSFQIDQAERGFSFRLDGPLDMRMSLEGPTAADVVNTMDEAELARIIATLGEERFARRVARAIVAARPLVAHRRTGRCRRESARPRRAAPADPSRDAHVPGAASPRKRRTRRTLRAASKRRSVCSRRMAVSSSSPSIRSKIASSSSSSRSVRPRCAKARAMCPSAAPSAGRRSSS